MNAVEFDRVSKSYSIYENPGNRLKELAVLGRRSFHRDFRALGELSFSIRRGEVFCIIGENGSGKSTALQLIAGILQPTSGEVRVNGRVAALLELGAGFNPEFTGRENVYLNGAILGLSRRDIDSRYKEIEAFAEIGDFINRPVKTYSSGMVVRLAFAVAIHVDPEILLVDEALAVGDTYFRHRCMRRVHELRARGITIIFVSHSTADVKAIGERALWLDHGTARALGDIDAVLPAYLAAMTTDKPVNEPVRTEPQRQAVVRTIPNIDHRHGDRRAEVIGIAVMNEYGEPLHLMTPHSRILVRISVRACADLKRTDVGFMMRNHLGLDFSGISATAEGHSLPSIPKGKTLTLDFQIDIPELYPGAFSFSPWIEDAGDVCDWIDNAVTVQMARGEASVYGYVHWPSRIELNSALETEQGIG
ncbi:MAG: lipopolysaccharide transport system ATP-binding protein [Bryobacterales bacterium]|nr:lipopolysaccharide transport system ATP-binding protein [Bryobacterales bacterium]